MKKRSILVLVLSMLLVLSMVLAGCAGGGGTAEATQEAAAATEAPKTETKEEATEETEEEPAEPAAERKTVSWAFWDMAILNPEEKITAYAFDQMNLIIDPIPLSWDTGGEQTKLFAASDSMPDCVSTYTASDLGRFYSWIDQGIIRDIPEEMVNEFEYVKASCDAYLSLQAVKKIKDNKYWFIPRADFADPTMYTAHRCGTYYRRDWAKKLGFDVDKLESAMTLDEYYEVVKAFTFNDPDGDGANNTVGITCDGGFPPIVMCAYGIRFGYWIMDDADGLYKPNYVSKKDIVADAYTFVQKLYQEGILDPEFLTNGYKEALAKITSSTAGSLTRNGDDTWIAGTMLNYWWESNPDSGDPLEIIGLFSIPTAYEGQSPSIHSYLQTCGTEIASHVDDDTLRAVLNAQNWMISPEGIEYKIWGFEGEDYNVVDGKKVKVPSDEKPKYESYRLPGSLGDWGMSAYLDDDLIYANAVVYEADKGFPVENYLRIYERIRAFRAYRNTLHDPSLNDLSINYISTPAKDELALDWGGRLNQMVTDGSDIKAGLDALIAEYMDKGLATAIEELNALV
mgnify:CR=1 FL=1